MSSYKNHHKKVQKIISKHQYRQKWNSANCIEYEVKYVGQSYYNSQWMKAENIPKRIIQEYEMKERNRQLQREKTRKNRKQTINNRKSTHSLINNKRKTSYEKFEHIPYNKCAQRSSESESQQQPVQDQGRVYPTGKKEQFQININTEYKKQKNHLVFGDRVLKIKAEIHQFYPNQAEKQVNTKDNNKNKLIQNQPIRTIKNQQVTKDQTIQPIQILPFRCISLQNMGDPVDQKTILKQNQQGNNQVTNLRKNNQFKQITKVQILWHDSTITIQSSTYLQRYQKQLMKQYLINRILRNKLWKYNQKSKRQHNQVEYSDEEVQKTSKKRKIIKSQYKHTTDKINTLENQSLCSQQNKKNKRIQKYKESTQKHKTAQELKNDQKSKDFNQNHKEAQKHKNTQKYKKTQKDSYIQQKYFYNQSSFSKQSSEGDRREEQTQRIIEQRMTTSRLSLNQILKIKQNQMFMKNQQIKTSVRPIPIQLIKQNETINPRHQSYQKDQFFKKQQKYYHGSIKKQNCHATLNSFIDKGIQNNIYHNNNAYNSQKQPNKEKQSKEKQSKEKQSKEKQSKQGVKSNQPIEKHNMNVKQDFSFLINKVIKQKDCTFLPNFLSKTMDTNKLWRQKIFKKPLSNFIKSDSFSNEEQINTSSTQQSKNLEIQQVIEIEDSQQ